MQLFRLETPGPPGRPEALAEGLRRHLAVAPLLNIAARIGARQQAYVALPGCGGCAHGRCLPGCRAELLRRTLRGAFGAGARLLPVARGLASRPYTRAALAWPTPAARPLTAELLHPYDDARLCLSWLAAPGARLRLSALLALGAAGPGPAETLSAHGWRALVLPAWLIPRAAALLKLPWAGAWPLAPALLLAGEPAQATVPAVAGTGADQLALRRSTYLHLQAILDGTSPDAGAPAEAEWPAGPGSGSALMRPADVAAFARLALAAPETLAGDEPGLSRRRVAALLAEPHRQHAETLLRWFAAAGVLAPPADDAQPFRRPRPLAEHDPARIAERLAATPLPERE